MFDCFKEFHLCLKRSKDKVNYLCSKKICMLRKSCVSADTCRQDRCHGGDGLPQKNTMVWKKIQCCHKKEDSGALFGVKDNTVPSVERGYKCMEDYDAVCPLDCRQCLTPVERKKAAMPSHTKTISEHASNRHHKTKRPSHAKMALHCLYLSRKNTCSLNFRRCITRKSCPSAGPFVLIIALLADMSASVQTDTASWARPSHTRKSTRRARMSSSPLVPPCMRLLQTVQDLAAQKSTKTYKTHEKAVQISLLECNLSWDEDDVKSFHWIWGFSWNGLKFSTNSAAGTYTFTDPTRLIVAATSILPSFALDFETCLDITESHITRSILPQLVSDPKIARPNIVVGVAIV